jgi:ABC-type oligopeptide transport system ATPase subunit
VVRQVADRVAVMHMGRIVEFGETDQVISRPEHPYTQKLLSAVPVVGGRRRRTPVPDPA